MRTVWRPIVAAAAILATVTAPAPAAPAVVPTPHAALDDMFHVYGDAGTTYSPAEPRQWTGGDSTYSVPLPDGRTVWIFSDTFLSPTNACTQAEQPCHRRGLFTPLVNNTFVVEQGGTLVRTLHGGTPAAPTALIRPPAPHDRRSFYWMGDGVVEGDRLRVFVRRFPVMGTLPPSAEAVDIATFSLPDLTLLHVDEGISASGVRPWAFLPRLRASTVPVTWGAAVMEDGEFTYVYGTEEYPLFKHLHVARVPRGQLLTGQWQYFDGSGWSDDPLESTSVLDGVAGELSVTPSPTGHRLVTSRGGIGDVYLHRAPAPEGPWDSGLHILTPPERSRGADVYNAKEHEQLSTAGSIVLSYNVNGRMDGNDVYADTHVYRPRFVEVALDE